MENQSRVACNESITRPKYMRYEHSAVETAAMDLQSEIARISRKQNEVRQFCTEMRKPASAPWPLLVASMAAGAALFGGGMLFAKVIGV